MDRRFGKDVMDGHEMRIMAHDALWRREASRLENINAESVAAKRTIERNTGVRVWCCAVGMRIHLATLWAAFTFGGLGKHELSNLWSIRLPFERP